MPNGNAAQGLIPRRLRNGETENGSLNEYYVDPAYATAIFMGDPVILSGSGSPEGVPGVGGAGRSRVGYDDGSGPDNSMKRDSEILSRPSFCRGVVGGRLTQCRADHD